VVLRWYLLSPNGVFCGMRSFHNDNSDALAVVMDVRSGVSKILFQARFYIGIRAKSRI